MYRYLTPFIPAGTIWPDLIKRVTDSRFPGEAVVERACSRKWRASYGYRFAPGFHETHRTVCENDSLNQAILQYQKSRDSNLLPVHKWLKEKLHFLKFDWRRARSIIAVMEPDTDSPLAASEYRQLLTGSCQRLRDGQHAFSVDRFGRVHTLVTSLAKDLRCCLSVGGQPLVGWDLKNSQPSFAGLLARRFDTSKDARYRLCQTEFKISGNPYAYESLGISSHGGKANQTTLPITFIAASTANSDESFGTDRNRVKRAMLTILMGPKSIQSTGQNGV